MRAGRLLESLLAKKNKAVRLSSEEKQLTQLLLADQTKIRKVYRTFVENSRKMEGLDSFVELVLMISKAQNEVSS